MSSRMEELLQRAEEYRMLRELMLAEEKSAGETRSHP